MSYQSEAQLEQNLINKLIAQGFNLVTIPDYDALVANFRVQINKFNADVLNGQELTDIEFDRLMNHLLGKSVFQSAKQLRDMFVLEREDGTSVYLKFISDNYEMNIYQVTNQITVVGKYKNRYDVTILCNGLPIVQIELKRSGVDIKEAINQIDRYRVHSYKGLFHYIQFFVVSNSVETRYFANTDQQRIQKSLTFYWTDVANERLNNLNDFCEDLLSRRRLNLMINKYMILPETDRNLVNYPMPKGRGLYKE